MRQEATPAVGYPALLERGARELGVRLSPRQLSLFRRYYAELVAWNARVNLTAITDWEEVQRLHFLDSLTLCRVLPETVRASGRVLDVGTGAGFPGLALKIALPGIKLTLVEATAKKTAFLEAAVASLGLEGVEILTGRAETLAHRDDLREAFDAVVSRAVARMATLCELTLPFARLGGLVVAPKKGAVDMELQEAQKALAALGGRVRGVYPVTVEGLADGRVLVVLEKARPTPEKYPRRPGMPAKRPLAFKAEGNHG